MAIDTLDKLLAGYQAPRYILKNATNSLVAGRFQSTWATAGSPGAGSFDTTLAGVALSSTSALVNGQIPFFNPVSGNTYLGRFVASASQASTIFLVDRLWHNGGLTITQTTAQTINSATWPARDANGTTNGDGVMIGIEVSAACGAAAPAPTISYTNQAGTAGRSAGLWFPTANSPTAGAFYNFALQAGDTGVRSIQTYTQNTSWVSGTINLVAYRVIAVLELVGSWVPNSMDALSSGQPRLYDGSVPFIMVSGTSASAYTSQAMVIFTQG